MCGGLQRTCESEFCKRSSCAFRCCPFSQRLMVQCAGLQLRIQVANDWSALKNVQEETLSQMLQVGLWGLCPGIFGVGDVDENVQAHIRCVYVIVLVPRFTKQESLGHVTKHSHHSTLQHYVGNTICESSTWLGIDRKPHFTGNLSFICWKSDGFWRHSTPPFL